LLAAGTPTTSGQFLRTKAPERFRTTLTFAERVAYQYAIEEVYWQHRIWPEDNPEAKPPLNAAISPAEVEKKVSDYLRKSQLVTEERGSPITATELQAEMDRMANHARRPDVLRELFASLGNDPFVIAECLARPTLGEQLANELNVRANGRDGSLSRPLSSADDAARSAIAPHQAAYKLPEISVPLDCMDNTWTATTTANAPDARWGHIAVWTGIEMIVWGGNDGGNTYFATGWRYNPATDSWTTTSTTNAPAARWLHTAVWTGSEMIIWSGGDGTNFLNSGGSYNPAEDSWLSISTTNAPLGRVHHTAVWTGSEMIVWGGYDYAHGHFNSGGRYDPGTGSWVATSTVNAPSARWSHTAKWTGGEMIIWGGTDQTNYLNTGGRYNPSTNSWTPTGLTNAPLGRVVHTAVWTGNEMIVWGGVDSTFNDANTGGRYYPGNDHWIATNTDNAPSARDSHTAVWTGNEMIVWGGDFCCPGIDFNTGGRYNAGMDSWTTTSTANAPHARDSHTALWTGSEMMIWGGGYFLGSNFIVLNTGGIYCAQPSTPIVQSAASQKTHGTAGSFDIALPLNGTAGIECRTGGATNDYTLVITFNANVSVNGNPEAAVTSGIGMVGTGGVSNGGMVTIAGNVVTVPLTDVANAQTINVTLFGVNGSTNVVIPMGILIGDTTGNGFVNAGDVSQTKSQVGQVVGSTNFREDVNASGTITATDVAQVKANVGTSLPP